MIIEERTYAKEEFEGLVKELILSPNIAEEFRFKDSVLNLNPLFFPLLFKAISEIRNVAILPDERRLVSDLADLEVKLLNYSNILPTDLPDSILADRSLVNYFLADNSKAGFMDAEWAKFKDKIFETINSQSNKLELPFLEWCDKMLNMNWQRHKKNCRRPGCPEEISYLKRIQFIAKLIEDAVPQPVLDVTPIKNLSASPIEDVEPDENLNKPESKMTKKIQWLGTQRQLAELFSVLKSKGWIEKFEYETIKECFTESNSIQQYLKPGINKENGEATYPEIYKTNYDERFFTIKKNQPSS
jgi:hypothetical protein